MTDSIDITTSLSDENNKLAQNIMGKFLYYAWAVDLTMLVTLSALALMLTKGTKQTMNDAINFFELLCHKPRHCHLVHRF
jgi:hypothetical protein